MRVLITDKINENAAKILGDKIQCDFLPTMDEEALIELIPKYDAIIVRSQTKITKKIIEAGINLKVIARAGVGVDNIDISCATKFGIVVVNSPDGNTHAASEHTIALLLSMERKIPQAYLSIKNGLWERSKFTGHEVFGKTLGIIGFGKIGKHVAQISKALGMDIIIFDPYTTEETVSQYGYKYIHNINDFWPVCDYITIHTPKTPETDKLINEFTINLMKDNVKIINCARGGIIDEEALCDALKSGKVASCAIDVFESEPDIKKSPLFNLSENVILTPHLGASTSEAQYNVAIDVANQVREILIGCNCCQNAVNLPQMTKEKLEPVKNYMSLAENLGDLCSQINNGNINSVDITFLGELSNKDTQPLEIAILKGIFNHKIENVNYVNAKNIAKERGINVNIIKSDEKLTSLGSIDIKIKSNIELTNVKGLLFAPNIERIVKIDCFKTSIVPHFNMILIPHENKPSMVAKVADILAKYDINISNMQVANCEDDSSKSIMIINVDTKVNNDILNEISNINGVFNANYINLN